MRLLRAAPEYLLYTIALAWPLDLFQYVPYLNMTMTGILTILLLVLAARHIASGVKLRVPFDVLCPVGLLAILLVTIASRNGIGITWEVPGALALLVVTAHFASSRAAIERWLRASVFSAMAVTFLTLASRSRGIMPTAYSLQLPTTFTFAYDLHAAVHILTLCLVLAVYFTLSTTENEVIRTLTTGATILIGGTLAAKGLQLLLSKTQPAFDSFLSFSPLMLAAFVTTLWLFLRIMAKVEVDRRERPGRMHVVFLTMGLATVILIALGPFQPRLYHGYLLGLACGYALREREDSCTIVWPKTACAALIALALINPWVVFPQNKHDPRNYELTVEREFLQGKFNTLLQRLDYFEAHSKDELRTHLWRARVAMRQGEPNGASMEFALSLQDESARRLVLPAPTEAETADFVVQLRDLTSTLPENRAGCAYERALLAIGERDSALLSLQLRTSIALVHAQGLDTDAFAEAAAFVLGDPSLRPDLATWTANELLTLLSHWGAEIRTPPEDFPATALPAILVLQRRPSNVDLHVALGTLRKTFHESIEDSPFRTRPAQEEPTRIEWGPETPRDNGTFTHLLSLTTPNANANLGHLEISDDLLINWKWIYDDQEPLPFTPAILIYLP